MKKFLANRTGTKQAGMPQTAAALLALWISGCGGSSGGGQGSQPEPPPPPVAVAGVNQEVGALDTVLLDGSGSFSQDGELVSWIWEQIDLSGLVVSIQQDVSSPAASFVAPDIDTPVQLAFRLTVVNGIGAQSTDDVEVIVLPVVVLALRPEDVSLTLGSSTNPRPIGAFDGWLYGRWGNSLYRSPDGDSWELIETFGPGTTLESIMPLGDGEVLINNWRTLLKSQGWSNDPLTASFSPVLETSNTDRFRFDPSWGVDVKGDVVFAIEYGSGRRGEDQYAWLSTDSGETFMVVWDMMATLTQDPGINVAQSHNHGAAYDEYEDRLWVVTGDSGGESIWYSDDLGASWVRLTDIPASDIDGVDWFFTTVWAYEDGIMLGSDQPPNGIGWIPRTSPSELAVQRIFTFPDDDIPGPTTNVAAGFRQVGDSGLVFPVFRSNQDIPSHIVAIDRGRVFPVWTDPDWQPGRPDLRLRHVIEFNGELFGYYTSTENGALVQWTFRSTVPQRVLDPGTT